MVREVTCIGHVSGMRAQKFVNVDPFGIFFDHVKLVSIRVRWIVFEFTFPYQLRFPKVHVLYLLRTSIS